MVIFSEITEKECVNAVKDRLTGTPTRKRKLDRDNFLTLPGWFTRDDINDIIFSICVS